MKEITYERLNEILKEQSGAFLCGNGFSINFDNDFGNIYDRLYEVHKILIRNGKYKVNAKNHVFKKVFTDNYNNVINYVRNISKNEIDTIFKDGVSFAESMATNEKLLKELESEDKIETLEFGKTNFDLVQSIYEIGITKGFQYVNIEYWTILIYFYFAILDLETTIYQFPENNDFILLIKLGHINKNPLTQKDIYYIPQYVLSNGFNTYYRMLFCTAILGNKKAIDYSLLENVNYLNINGIKKFLNSFEITMTLNYDWILNYLVKKIVHLHGKFIAKEEFVYNQSLGVAFDDNTYISYSDILIGDYFINKISAAILYGLNKDPINKKVFTVFEIIKAFTKKYNINVFVIFGMSIDNDQHIIRTIMTELASQNKENAKIIYCYFSDEDKNTFEEQYNASITFSKELTEKVKKIELLYIKTQDLLQEYFYKK